MFIAECYENKNSTKENKKYAHDPNKQRKHWFIYLRLKVMKMLIQKRWGEGEGRESHSFIFCSLHLKKLIPSSY